MPRKEENEAEALAYLDLVMKQIPEQGLSYPMVIKEIIIKFQVTKWFVEQSIKFFYLNTNQIILKDNIIKKGE